MQDLNADSRELIVQYYQEEKKAKIDTRRKLAADLGIDLNALRVRAHRIRFALQRCVSECLAKETSEQS